MSVISKPEHEIVVRALKFDRREHRRWGARLQKRDGELLVLDAEFDKEVRHPQLGLIRRGTLSIEYYWLDRWYNVFRFLEPDGQLRSFYCNVNMPPEFDGRTLSYVDLDIDILVAPNLDYEILDMDEFESNAEVFNYPKAVRESAHRAVHEIISLVTERRFPFDDSRLIEP